MSFAKTRAFIHMTRPFFLLGGVLLYVLGVVVALKIGTPFHLGYFLLGQGLVTSVQLMVHYVNEYYDQDVDKASTDRTWFSGGSGMLATGVLQPSTALRAAQACLGMALIILLAILALDRSPGLAALLVLALLAGWYYSAPPLRLVSRGLGEAAGSLVMALLVPLTGFLLQTGGSTIPIPLLALCLLLVLVHISTMVAIEYPDREADAAYGKRTLMVRLGLQRAALLYESLLTLAFGLLAILAVSRTLNRGEVLIFLAVPVALWQVFRLHWQLRHPGASYRWFATGAVGLFALAAFLALAGMLLTSPI